MEDEIGSGPKMDNAAGEAETELRANISAWTAVNLAEWWSRWYLKAGHKRLGRVLVAIAKNPSQKA